VSRKKFSNDLNSLFGFTPEVESFQEENPLLNNEDTATATLVAPKKEVAKKVSRPVAKKSTRKSSKNFHSDLEELFQEAFQEKMEQLSEENSKPEVKIVEQKKTVKPTRVRKIRPRMGLDSLIRNTQNLSPEQIQVHNDQKRVTFLYSKTQLEKLREISKKDSRFMKDIIGEAVNQWIKDYKEEIA